MADISDVESAVVAQLFKTLYPDGDRQPNIIGAACRVYRGWPSPATLNADLAAGGVNVTVFPDSSPDEILSPYFDKPHVTVLSSGLAATIAGNRMTFTGSILPGERVGALVDGKPYEYSVIDGDTIESVAANLMTIINADRTVSLAGSTLTVPGSHSLIARVVSGAAVLRELRRTRKDVQVSCWCPSLTLRDFVSEIVTAALPTTFMSLGDGSMMHIRYVSTQVFDQSENALLFRRDLIYKCEYTTITVSTAPVMLFGDVVTNMLENFV